MSRHIAAVTSMVVVAATLLSGGAWANPSTTSPAPGQQPPVNTDLPSISGTAQAGNTLTASPGTWDGKALKYAYQWQRCDSSGANCGPVGGATSSTYTLSSADVGDTMRIVVTASNQNGSAVATSAATTVIAAATSAPPPSSTATLPSNTSLPTISGSAQQGQTLVASPGAWSGSTPMSYAYQWQRCDSSGGSCAAISGAAATSYVLASADVGSTIRVSVTANNSAGSGSATSAATAGVTGSTTSWSGAYYSEYFDGIQNVLTRTSNASACSEGYVSGFSNQALDVTAGGAASASSYGQLCAGAWQDAHYAHAGWLSGTDTVYGNGFTEESWYRFKLRFPSDYQATPGGQNSLFEIHVDGKSEQDAKSFGQGAYSNLLDVRSDGSCGTSNGYSYCTAPGTSPRLFLQVAGGRTSDPMSTTRRQYEWTGNGIQLNHWYDIVLHYVFSPDPTVGYVQLWVDGVKVHDAHEPTAYVRSDGTQGFGDDISACNYQLWHNWSDSVDYDQMVWGPTAGSIGFTP